MTILICSQTRQDLAFTRCWEEPRFARQQLSGSFRLPQWVVGFTNDRPWTSERKITSKTWSTDKTSGYTCGKTWFGWCRRGEWDRCQALGLVQSRQSFAARWVSVHCYECAQYDPWQVIRGDSKGQCWLPLLIQVLRATEKSWFWLRFWLSIPLNKCLIRHSTFGLIASYRAVRALWGTRLKSSWGGSTNNAPAHWDFRVQTVQ